MAELTSQEGALRFDHIGNVFVCEKSNLNGVRRFGIS